MQSTPKQPQGESTRVFLSYSRQDLAFVDRLAQALKDRGITVYIDHTEIEKGVDWWERIRQLIEKSDTLVFVLSPDSARSDVCSREIEYAESLGKRLVPAVYLEVDNAEVPEALARINYVFFTDSDRSGNNVTFETAVDELITALLMDLDWVREHTRLGELARHWDSVGRPPDLLLRGRPLRAAVDWLHDSLARDGSHGLDESNATHAFIQTSAKGYYTLGLFGWRYRFIALPAIVLVSILALIGVWILDGVYDLGLFSALGVKNDKDLAALGGQFALTLFVAYTLASIRRRYLIARHVNFFGKWKARRFALRSVIYILTWLAAAFFVLYLFLD